MSSLQERAKARRANITLKKVALHAESHHSFHTHLDTKSAWGLLSKLSQEAWREQTGELAGTRVDKSVVKFITQS